MKRKGGTLLREISPNPASQQMKPGISNSGSCTWTARWHVHSFHSAKGRVRDVASYVSAMRKGLPTLLFYFTLPFF